MREPSRLRRGHRGVETFHLAQKDAVLDVQYLRRPAFVPTGSFRSHKISCRSVSLEKESKLIYQIRGFSEENPVPQRPDWGSSRHLYGIADPVNYNRPERGLSIELHRVLICLFLDVIIVEPQAERREEREDAQDRCHPWRRHRS